MQCDADTYAAPASSACTRCRDNSSAPAGSSSEDACLCDPGFHQQSGACAQCALGRYKATVSNEPCTPCASGEYSGVLGAVECVACLQNSQSLPTEGGAKCVCSAGYFQEDVALERPACQPCAADTYQHLTGTTACSRCPAHASSPLASPAIYACICGPGMFEVDMGECAACAAGAYKEQALDDEGDVAACLACSENKTSLPGSARVEDCVCRRGFFGTAAGECLACAAGTFKNATGSAACAPCAVSSFSVEDALEGTVACASCVEALGSLFAITRREGSVSVAACVCHASAGFDDVFDAGFALCGTGTFARFEDPAEYEAPASVCVDCVLGQYADVAGLVACKSCLPFSSSHEYPRVRCHCDGGYTFDSFAASTLAPEDRVSGVCKACAPSTYKDIFGDQECSTCPTNSSSPIASVPRASCECDPGYYGSDGGPCTICAPNYYKSEKGTAVCTECPPHAVSASGNAALLNCRCDVGYTGPDGGHCALCAAGKFKEAVGPAECDACVAGKFLESTGACSAGTCVACAAGKFSTAEGAALAGTCVNCPADTYSSTAEGVSARVRKVAPFRIRLWYSNSVPNEPAHRSPREQHMRMTLKPSSFKSVVGMRVRTPKVGGLWRGVKTTSTRASMLTASLKRSVLQTARMGLVRRWMRFRE